MYEIHLCDISAIEVNNKVNSDVNNEEYIRTLCVNGYKHKRIRNWCCCLSLNYTDFNWKKMYISYGRVGFLVYYTEEHPVYKLVIRPAKQYFKIEFEQLFRFGLKNRGYTETRMIALIRPNKK